MKQIIRRVAALVIGLGLGGIAVAGLESVTHISDLNASWPLGSDLASTSDDHIRNIKTALKNDFPNITGVMTATQTQLNQLTGVSVSTGDILYASGTNQLAKLADVASGGFLRSGGVGSPPQWSGLVIPNSASQGDLLYGSASNIVSVLSKDTNSTRYLSNTGSSNNPAWAQVDLTTGVTGLLPFSNINLATVPTFTASNPTIILSSAVPLIRWQETDAATDNKIWEAFADSAQFNMRITGDSTGAANWLTVVRSGASTISSVNLQGTAIQTNGVDVTAATGTFTATYTGFTAGVTCTATWSRIGKLVSLFFCTATGTSNATSFTMTGLPSAIQPASLTQTMALPIGPVQNATIIDTTVSVTVTSASGTVTFLHNGSSSGWTNSGTKGFSSGATISYLLN